MFLKSRRISPFLIILLGFLAVILAGTFLLMLPLSSQTHQFSSFPDALFTSTSAVCVTGLIVQDTATYWSTFGQAVIIILIQTGGIGVITAAVFVALISGKKIGLYQRNLMQEAMNAPYIGGIVKLTKFILTCTFSIELCGAAIMAPVFIRDFGIKKGLWYSVFHSISAFCNAGFDLMGVREKYSSLTSYVGNPVINLTISGLIIVGGIGFFTWKDIAAHGIHVKRYRLQTKLILIVTSVLILVPTICFYFFEFRDGPVGTRILESLFQAVSPRTAGFNTVPLDKMTDSGQFITIILMLIGGAPGSTAGGMKVTTAAILFITMAACLQKKDNSTCFGRRIEMDALKSAVTVFSIYIIMFCTGAMIISTVEGLPLISCMYETASALDTVGLTLGLTPKLGMVSRTILVLYMYLGRVGIMTLAYAIKPTKAPTPAKFPAEKIMIG